MTGSKKGSRVVLISALVGTAFFIVAGLFLWRMIPAIALANDLERDFDDYTSLEDIPVVLPEADLSDVTVALIELPDSGIISDALHYRGELSRWREWLADARATVVEPEEADVLILPLADCIGNDTRRLIERRLASGGGLVTSGILGARGGSCQVVGDTILNDLLGRNEGEQLLERSDSGPTYVMFPGETALSVDVPAGARIELEPQSHVVFRGEQREAFFAHFERDPIRLHGEDFFDGAVARAVVEEGRVVAFGFGMAEITGPWSEQIGRLVLRNAVRWAGGRPNVQLAMWPEGYSAAAVVAQDVEADFANAAAAVDVIEAKGIPTTYFITGQLAERNAFVTRDMARTGEIASHSFSHLPMDRFTRGEQLDEIRKSMESAQEFSEFSVRGFRPPEERFDLSTLQGWAEVGGDYFFASDRGKSAGPVMVPLGEDTLVFIGRVTDDDYALLGRHEMRDRAAMVTNLVGEMDEAVEHRGAYMFSYHSHLFSQAQLIPVLEAVIDALKERSDLWVATAGEVATWWRARSAVQVGVADDGFSAEIRNTGTLHYRRGQLLIDLPNGERRTLKVPDLEPGSAVRLRWDQ